MRPVLFRGQDKNGAIYVGGIVYLEAHGKQAAFIVNYDGEKFNHVEVEPSTVTQFVTSDDDGVALYEGDVVTDNDGNIFYPRLLQSFYQEEKNNYFPVWHLKNVHKVRRKKK